MTKTNEAVPHDQAGGINLDAPRDWRPLIFLSLGIVVLSAVLIGDTWWKQSVRAGETISYGLRHHEVCYTESCESMNNARAVEGLEKAADRHGSYDETHDKLKTARRHTTIWVWSGRVLFYVTFVLIIVGVGRAMYPERRTVRLTELLVVGCGVSLICVFLMWFFTDQALVDPYSRDVFGDDYSNNRGPHYGSKSAAWLAYPVGFVSYVAGLFMLDKRALVQREGSVSSTKRNAVTGVIVGIIAIAMLGLLFSGGGKVVKAVKKKSDVEAQLESELSRVKQALRTAKGQLDNVCSKARSLDYELDEAESAARRRRVKSELDDVRSELDSLRSECP